jgi:inorganic pyrophosphatase
MTWRRIEHFFVHYKDLEPNKWAKITGWGDAQAARELIGKAIERAKASK